MQELFVTCPFGIEHLLSEELKSLGLEDIRKSYGGVFAPKSIYAVYLINYCSRLATRVLWPLAHFPCRDRQALYDGAKKIDWTKYITLKTTFSIDANVNHPMLRNSLFAALVVKDAICDTFRDKFNERPSVDTTAPDIQLNLFIQKGMATISFDTSGAPLYKRGWRKDTVAAPLQESVAAALLKLCNYSTSKVLCDPFCGSGTLLVEAAMMATNTPPGTFRKSWGFMHMPQFSLKEWSLIKEEYDQKKIPLSKGCIIGADKDPKAVSITREHLKVLGLEGSIEVVCKEIRNYRPSLSPSLVITNPPYGKRLQASSEAYRSLGQFIKEGCSPSVETYVLCPERRQVLGTELQVKKSFPFSNGGLDVELFSLLP